MTNVGFILTGFAAGALGGLVGIGGGIIIVPLLVLLFGFPQHLAQGTTLAMMLPPIGAYAVWAYYRNGNVNLAVAGLLCLGFLAGSVLGSEAAARVNGDMLRKIFGVLMIVSGVKMFF